MRAVRSPRSDGISPVNPLPERSRVPRAARLSSAAGISLVSPFLLRSRTSRPVRSPTTVGMAPLRLFDGSSSTVTRPSEPVSVSTPCQSSRGAWLSQLVLSSQLSPPVASYRVLRTGLSTGRASTTKVP